MPETAGSAIVAGKQLAHEELLLSSMTSLKSTNQSAGWSGGMFMQRVENRGELPALPVFATGPDFPMATLKAFEEHAHRLIDGATKGVPRRALKIADAVSRRWLVKSGNAHLDEIDAIAARLRRPGAYYLSVNYEWGCTVGVRPGEAGTAELVRVLDWRTPGLGRHVIAAQVAGPAGPFMTLTWPGYTGVLQASAPARFAAAINQAPMARRGGGFYPLDWLANKVEVWRSRAITPAHLLRAVFEEASDFSAARSRLIETEIAAPAIFSLVGITADELCIVERTEVAAHVHDGRQAAANMWQAPGWRGRARGFDSRGRARQMMGLSDTPLEDFAWLAAPILNPLTRVAMAANPATGRLVAQGFEGEQEVTAVLRLE